MEFNQAEYALYNNGFKFYLECYLKKFSAVSADFHGNANYKGFIFN